VTATAHQVAPLTAADVMSSPVLSVSPDASLAEAIGLMLDRHISGLLVVDANGDMIGVLTEGDLLRRHEIATTQHRSWLSQLFTSSGKQANAFTRTHGRRVHDVMTEAVIAVSETTPLVDIVELMENHGIKRVPVLHNGRPVGVVSRADLLRALLAVAENPLPSATDDATIGQSIRAALQAERWAPTTTLDVTVKDGVVELSGIITSDGERRAVTVIAENTPGVKQVIDQLVWIEVYSGTVIEAPKDGGH
jgi:CBS domain-containing protein